MPAARNDDLAAGVQVARNVVFKLLSIVRDQCAQFLGTLAALSFAHLDLSAGEDVPIAYILPDVDLLLVALTLVVESNKAEFVSKNFREDLRESELLLLLSCLRCHVEEGDPAALSLTVLVYLAAGSGSRQFVCCIYHFYLN